MIIFCKFPTVNISKPNFWLNNMHGWELHWTTLKVIFSIFRFSCTFRFQIFSYICISIQILSYPIKPYINGKLIYSDFRWCINLNFEKITLMVQGHIYGWWLLLRSLLLLFDRILIPNVLRGVLLTITCVCFSVSVCACLHSH